MVKWFGGKYNMKKYLFVIVILALIISGVYLGLHNYPFTGFSIVVIGFALAIFNEQLKRVLEWLNRYF